MNEKLVKGLMLIAIGGIAINVVMKLRDRRLEKELYEAVEVYEDEYSAKE